jgi:hypothetical protein
MKASPSPLAAATTAAALPTVTQGHVARQGSGAQRALLSSNFGSALTRPLTEPARAAGAVGRGLLNAGDRLRDLIVPDALVSVIANPWVGITGGAAGAPGRKAAAEGEKAEKARRELEDVLAAACPLCEGVVAGLDRPFVADGEVDASWEL